jgi:hypothetical protein
MKAICVNGPPRAGKDTVCEMISEILVAKRTPHKVDKFALPLNTIAQATTGMDLNTFQKYREELKDSPLPGYPDISMRDLLIFISEDFCKILFGREYFAVHAFNRLTQQSVYELDTPYKIVMYSDSGFQYEYDYFKQLVELIATDSSVYLIGIRRDGCNFDNDSRQYVTDDDMFIIENNDSLDALREQVSLIVDKILD